MKLKCEHLSESPVGPVEAKTVSPTPEVSDWIELGGTQELEFFHKFPDEADAAGMGTTVENPFLLTHICLYTG